MIRRDVMNLAERLDKIAGLSAEDIYRFLLKVWTVRGFNPKRLEWEALPGVVYEKGHRWDCYFERMTPTYPTMPNRRYRGPDYEGMILARQDEQLED